MKHLRNIKKRGSTASARKSILNLNRSCFINLGEAFSCRVRLGIPYLLYFSIGNITVIFLFVKVFYEFFLEFPFYFLNTGKNKTGAESFETCSGFFSGRSFIQPYRNTLAGLDPPEYVFLRRAVLLYYVLYKPSAAAEDKKIYSLFCCNSHCRILCRLYFKYCT